MATSRTRGYLMQCPEELGPDDLTHRKGEKLTLLVERKMKKITDT